MQLTKLKERMKVIISHVQQVEKKIDGVKINRSKVNNTTTGKQQFCSSIVSKIVGLDSKLL